MGTKIDGLAGVMLKRHEQFSERGRTTTARQANFVAKVDDSVSDVMIALATGVDQVPALANDSDAIKLINDLTTWLTQQHPVLPLHLHVNHVSHEFRALIPTFDPLPREQKKRAKKALLAALEDYLLGLIRTERRHHVRTLGRRTR